MIVPMRIKEGRLSRHCTLQIKRAEAQKRIEGRAPTLRAQNPRIGVQRPQCGLHRVEFRTAGEIGFVEQQHIGKRDLAGGFFAVCQARLQMLGVNHRDDRVQRSFGAHVFIGEKGLRNGGWIGEPGGLHNDAVKPALALHQPGQNADQIAAHGAAHATIVHLEHFFVGADDEVVINADLAKLIDDDGVLFAVRLRQDAVEQGRLAGAEIAGKDGDRDLGGCGHGAVPGRALARGQAVSAAAMVWALWRIIAT